MNEKEKALREKLADVVPCVNRNDAVSYEDCMYLLSEIDRLRAQLSTALSEKERLEKERNLAITKLGEVSRELGYTQSRLDAIGKENEELQSRCQRIGEANRADAIVIVEGFEREKLLEKSLSSLLSAVTPLFDGVYWGEDKGVYPVDADVLRNLNSVVQKIKEGK